jgi:hypothetical protein
VTPHGDSEMRSLLQHNYKDQAKNRNVSKLYDLNDQWAKGSIGMISGSMAGFTSEKGLTEGLEYSSSALDVASRPSSHTNI